MKTTIPKPVALAILLGALIIVLGAYWYFMSRGSNTNVPTAAYPKSDPHAPSVQDVGLPADLVPAGGPTTPTNKGK